MNWYQVWDWLDIKWFSTKEKAFDWLIEKILYHLRHNTFVVLGFIFLIILFRVLLYRAEKRLFKKIEKFWDEEEEFVADIMREYNKKKEG